MPLFCSLLCSCSSGHVSMPMVVGDNSWSCLQQRRVLGAACSELVQAAQCFTAALYSWATQTRLLGAQAKRVSAAADPLGYAPVQVS